jgi:molybdopterin-guanine dinucleotide biosynthesis protein A
VYFPKVEIGEVLIDPFFNINEPEELDRANTVLKGQAQ